MLMFVYQEMAQLNHTTILSSSFQFLSLLVMKIQPGQASHMYGSLHLCDKTHGIYHY